MGTRWAVGAVLLFVVGCGFPAAKVDDARAHVQRALEVWKSGGKPDALQSQTPATEFHEAMWNAGDKLVSFDVGAARYVDTAAVVRCDVKLTLRGRNNKERTENVTYDVTLGPPVKVVNNPMP